MRLLLWGILVFAIVLLILHIKKIIARQASSGPESFQAPHDAPEAMLKCAECGIHVPASEAILVQSDLAFCSEEHRLKHLSS
jgi:uncharacterized protein